MARPNARRCETCIHWAARTDGERPHIHYGHELRKCAFFSPNLEGLYPHHVSKLAVVVLGWTGESHSDLMTSAGFGCIEWTEKPK